jgi:hypothetical protein
MHVHDDHRRIREFILDMRGERPHDNAAGAHKNDSVGLREKLFHQIHYTLETGSLAAILNRLVKVKSA